ncbi:hypothetical protein LTR84_011670 [Exophiala bonariae]|uniref:Fe2OG dioxygenase domain-containing protein n=1 Tax=Exophiala bonariae TaxID=1690606 RepID=A0AAV9NKA3_9EURO|nr:hypothetical protein LTR84_011670 [Exophiala bonariae]
MAKPVIPVISFEPFLNGQAADRKMVAEQVYAAFRDIGFMYVKDTGISQARIDELFALAKDFFDLPLDFKQRYALRDPTENQGYSAQGKDMGFDHESKAMKKDYKEAYEHRRYKNELCPTAEELAAYNPRISDFHAILDGFYKEAFKLSEEVLACLALALDLPGGEEYFKPITGDSDPQLRLLHYPPVPASAIAAATAQDGAGKDGRIRPHCDYSLCTLLFQDSIGGLEIDPFHTGKFTPAPPKSGTVLINIGDLLHRLLNGRVKSTMHRVVAPEAFTSEDGSEPILPSRYSIPFFVHPVPEALIEPILLDPAEKKMYKEVNAGDWRSWRTARNYMMPEREQYFLDKLGIAHELPQNAAALGCVTAGGN